MNFPKPKEETEDLAVPEFIRDGLLSVVGCMLLIVYLSTREFLVPNSE